MIEYRLSEQDGRLSLNTGISGMDFENVHRDRALILLSDGRYATHQTRKGGMGKGSVAVFVMEDRLRLRMVDLLGFLPVSLYVTLLLIYLVLTHPPALFGAESFMQFYLNTLQSLSFHEGTQSYGFSLGSAMVLWMMSGGVITLLFALPLFTLVSYYTSFLPSRVYRFLYYNVLGLLVKTQDDGEAS